MGDTFFTMCFARLSKIAIEDYSLAAVCELFCAKFKNTHIPTDIDNSFSVILPYLCIFFSVIRNEQRVGILLCRKLPL